MDDRDWDRLVTQLKCGDCTPFLGAGACHPTLPTGSSVSAALADEYGYPFEEGRNDLSRVAQYVAMLYRDRTVPKTRLVAMIREADPPDFTRADEPHALLARFPLPVYLTTNYDNFMFKALEETEGKSPRRMMCRWWENGSRETRPLLDNGHNPSRDEPIVYHLHGNCTDAPSLALTESDYLDFLINVTMSRGQDGRLSVPVSIHESLMKPLLFIGYSLQDWTFRVLFNSLLRTIADSHRRRHVSVQLHPRLNSDDPESRARAERYLNTYFEDWNVSVYWGSAAKFCTDLRNQLGEHR